MQSKGGIKAVEQSYIDLSLVAGSNLKRLIKSSTYKTQEAFAVAFGTDVRTVRRWINQGIRCLDTLQQLALFFGVDVFTLLSY